MSKAEFGRITDNCPRQYVDPGSPLAADVNRRRPDVLSETLVSSDAKSLMKIVAAAALATNREDILGGPSTTRGTRTASRRVTPT
ncbi:hypothetical protein AB5J52_06035 [Streptomyces sp. R39]|uniref:Uncharacterized protein n=1 Tax=Streptomyces sp. R39 TaxID=3238631 RepID=A0AB39QES9_9ACTN